MIFPNVYQLLAVTLKHTGNRLQSVIAKTIEGRYCIHNRQQNRVYPQVMNDLL